MSKENRSVSRVVHKKVAKKNAVKFLAVLTSYVIALVLLFWLAIIIVTSADFYYADAFIPWKPLLRAIMFAAFFILKKRLQVPSRPFVSEGDSKASAER